MSFYRSKSWRRHGVAFVAACLLLLTSTLALAVGRIEWGNKTLKPRSDNVSWNVEITVHLPKPPDTPSLSANFEFKQTVLYERSLEDGDKHTSRKVPIDDNVQPIIVPVDIGFLDPRTGKIEKGTKFTFKLHRDHGFQCGEYKVTVRDTRNNSVIGAPTTVILGGDNEEIDRRSVVFSGEKKKEKKKTDDTSEKKDGDSAAASSEKTDAAEPPAAEVPPEPASSPVENEEVKKKPGGCGCSVPGNTDSSPTYLGLFFAITALFVGRKLSTRRAA